MQPSNAECFIEVTDEGITTEVKAVQLQNEFSPIEVTELGIVYEVSPPGGYRISVVAALSNKTPLILEYLGLDASTLIDANFVQFMKADDVIDATEEGIVIDVKEVQNRKVASPIEVIDEGSVMDAIEVQPLNA